MSLDIAYDWARVETDGEGAKGSAATAGNQQKEFFRG